MTETSSSIQYVLRLADNALILGQRLSELVAHGPELEEELATANFALDYLGQARLLYSYAGELEGSGRGEDDFAFLRGESEYRNLLLVEQANGHFGDMIVRQVLFESFYKLLLEALTHCTDERLAEIALRAEKEIRYHLRHVSQWLIRLGDGTDLSHDRVQASLDQLWQFTGEMFAGDEVDDLIRDRFAGPDLAVIKVKWQQQISDLIATATLRLPADEWMQEGGRQGRHSEQFGYLLAEMQTMQRTYPGLRW